MKKMICIVVCIVLMICSCSCSLLSVENDAEFEGKTVYNGNEYVPADYFSAGWEPMGELDENIKLDYVDKNGEISEAAYSGRTYSKDENNTFIMMDSIFF